RAIGAGAKFGRSVGNDERLAGRFAKFLQAAYDKRDGEPDEIVREQQRDGKEREEDERRQHEWSLAVFIGEMSNRDVAEHRRHHLDGDEPAELLGAYSAWFIAQRITNAYGSRSQKRMR